MQAATLLHLFDSRRPSARRFINSFIGWNGWPGRSGIYAAAAAVLVSGTAAVVGMISLAIDLR